MRRLLLVAGAAAMLGCTPTGQTVGTTVPGATAACAVLDSNRLDDAWKAYDVALDAINMLIDAKVLIPGSPRAKAVATANDRVLAALQAAEAARKACNSSSYLSALSQAKAAFADVRTALHSGG
jgi:hypothetical protein